MHIPSPTHSYLVDQLIIQLGQLKKLSIVDYGCGAGALLSYLPTNRVGQYIGFDVNQAALTQAKKQWGNTKTKFKPLTIGRVPKLAPTSSVDVIILVGVWQYLSTSEQKQLLDRAKQCLKKGGLLLISCSVNHWPYRFFNLYHYFVQHHYVDRQQLLTQLTTSNFKLLKAEEKGFFFAPLFSNVVTFFTDAVDYLLWRKPGAIGPVGETARLIASPIIQAEFTLPLDYGYTLFVTGKKQ
jgi:SAM-dependent methyltransferase